MKRKIQNSILFLTSVLAFKINAQNIFRYVKIPNEVIFDKNYISTEVDYEIYVKQSIGENRVNRNVKEGFFVNFAVLSSAEDSIKTYISLLSETNKFANEFQNKEILDKNAKHHYHILNSLSKDKASFMLKNRKNGDKVIYVDENNLKVSKILSKKNIADSVKIRSILLNNEDTAKEILKKIETGVITWDYATKNYNEYKIMTVESKESSFVPYGQLEKDINEYCFYFAKKGETKLIVTQYGFHLVQLTDSKFITNQTAIELLTFNKKLTVNESSNIEALKKAQSFIEKSKNVADFHKEVSLLFKKTEKFSQLNETYSLPIIDWLRTAEVGKISPTPFLNESGYTVAIVNNIRENVSYQEILKIYDNSVKAFAQKYNFESTIKEQSLETVAKKYNIAIEAIENIESSEVEFIKNEDFIDGIEKGAAYPTPYEGLDAFYLVKKE